MNGELQGFAPEQVVRWKDFGNLEEPSGDYSNSDFYEVQVMEGPTLPGTTLEDLDESVTLKNLQNGTIHKVHRGDLLKQNSNSLPQSAPRSALSSPFGEVDSTNPLSSERVLMQPEKSFRLKLGEIISLGKGKRINRQRCRVMALSADNVQLQDEATGGIFWKTLGEIEKEISFPPPDASVAA